MKKIRLGFLSLIVLGIMAVMPSKAWAQVTETYDFYSFATGDGYMEATGDAIAQIGESEKKTDVYEVKNLTIGETTMDFNNRFAFNPVTNSYQMFWRFRNTGTEYQKGLVCQWLSGKIANATANMSVLNLYKGDKITITYSIRSGKSAELHVIKSGVIEANGSAVNADEILVSGTEYTVNAADEDTPVNLDLYITDNNIGIHRVVIKSTKISETVSAPAIETIGANKGERIVRINAGSSSASNTVTTYYTIDGKEPTTESESFTGASKDITIGVGITEETDVTVKAFSVSSTSVKSEVGERNIAVGTVLKLNTPEISVTGMSQIGDVYYPVVTITSDQTTVIGNFSVVYQATFNGKSVALDNDSYTFTSAGTLTVTSSAAGYDDSEPVLYTASSYAVSTLYDFSNPEFTSLYTVGEEEGFEAGKQYNSATAFKSDFVGKTYVVKATGGIFDFMEFQTNHNLLEGIGILNVGTGNRWVKLTKLTDKVIAKFEFVTTNSGSETVVGIDGSSQTTIPRYNALKAITIYSPAQSVTISSDYGYSTFSSDLDVDFSANDGVTVYTAKMNDDNTVVKLTEVADKKVPAGAGVLLKGEGTFAGIVTTGVAAFADNAFVASEGGTAVTREDGIYVLNNKSGIGFYPFVGTLSKGKAHLVITNSEAKSIKMSFGDETTGISEIDATGEANGVYHTLSGIRVQNPTKGLYILNGKKVIIK